MADSSNLQYSSLDSVEDARDSKRVKVSSSTAAPVVSGGDLSDDDSDDGDFDIGHSTAAHYDEDDDDGVDYRQFIAQTTSSAVALNSPADDTAGDYDDVNNARVNGVDNEPPVADDDNEVDVPFVPFSKERNKELRAEARMSGYEDFIVKYMALNVPLLNLFYAFGFPLPPDFFYSSTSVRRDISAPSGDPANSGAADSVDGDEQTDEILRQRQWSLFAILLKKYCRQRFKLPQYNTIDDAVSLIRSARRILVLTGAGISVSCGIPDFRSENGLYQLISEKYPDLDDPQLMFDIHYFRHNHHPFFDLAKAIYPSNFQPSPTHRFIRDLERRGKLLRNYTQNIDTLESLVGIKRVIHCHGSFDGATCQRCGFKVKGDSIRAQVLEGSIPWCPSCTDEWRRRKEGREEDDEDEPLPILKPDIIFFGESLPREFDDSIAVDKDRADLMIVIGSSLKVSPVSELVGYVPHSVPLILINREPVYHYHRAFDVQLLGYCDTIVRDLWRRLGWSGGEDLDLEEFRKPTPAEQLAAREHDGIDGNSAYDVGGSGGGAGAIVEELAENLGGSAAPDIYEHVPPHIYLYEGYKFDRERHGRIFNDDDSDEGEIEWIDESSSSSASSAGDGDGGGDEDGPEIVEGKVALEREGETAD